MPSLLVAWSTWLALALFYAYQFVQRIVPNVIIEDIINKYHVDADGIGHFTGIYYIGYVAAHIPLGIVLDYFSAKKVIPVCILLAILGFAPLAYLDNFTVVTYGRFLIGFSSAGAVIGAFKLLRLEFGEKKFPKMLGWMITVGLLGATFGSGPFTRLIFYLGWIEALKYIIIFGIALAIFSYIIIPNTKSKGKFNFLLVVNDFKYLFSNKIIFLISGLGGLMIGPLEGFADAWSNQYLKTVYKFTNQEAGDITQLIYIGMAFGLVIMGYIFEKTKSYYKLIVISGITMLSCLIILLIKMVENAIILKCIFFIIGFFCAYQLFVIAKSITLVLIEHTTFISAIVNMIMMGFGYFTHRSIGKLLHHFWDGKLNALGSPIYSDDNFYYALMILLISLAIAILGYSFLAVLEKRKKKIIV